MFESKLPRSTPEDQGVDPAGILRFVEGMESKFLGPHSFMIARHGKVIAEGWWAPYREQDVHLLYSLSKSFTSTAVGFAASEGLLDLQDPVIRYFPEDLPSDVSENLALMRIRDLLTMNTGHTTEPQRGNFEGAAKENYVRGFLAHPVEKKPGTHFLYNTLATYMCSAILHKVTGETLLDYLGPRLMGPLGIEKAFWECCPRGIQFGGSGLSVTTESVAKFAQLFLQKGIWEGRQLLPLGWAEEATRAQVSNSDGREPHDWNQGYGYQFWRSRHGFYRGDGAFGQNAVVMDSLDMILVTTASNPDLAATHELIWEHILPAVDGQEHSHRQDLASKLETLDSWPLGTGGLPNLPSGTFRSEGTDLKVTFSHDGVHLEWRSGGKTQTIDAPAGRWQQGRANIDGVREQPIAARSAWLNDQLVVRACDLESPFCITITLSPQEENYRFEWSRFGDFGPTEGPRGFLTKCALRSDAGIL